MNKDIVYRQAAIDAILECCASDFDTEYECGYDDGLRQGVHRLKHLPSAEVEPTEEQIKKYILDHNLTHKVFEPVKRGKWMEMGTNADGTHNIKCSECGAGYKTKGHANSILTKAKYKFCPRCGAKMNTAEM